MSLQLQFLHIHISAYLQFISINTSSHFTQTLLETFQPPIFPQSIQTQIKSLNKIPHGKGNLKQNNQDLIYCQNPT